MRCAAASGIPVIHLARLLRDGRLTPDVFPEALAMIEQRAQEGDEYMQEAIDVWRHRNNQSG